MRVQLIAEENGQVIPVNVPSFTIGRSKEANLRSPSTHVSRKHCTIHTKEGVVTIQDLGGENGTYVNGERISSSQVLHNGDRIAVGTHSFTLSIAASVPEPAVIPLVTQEAVVPDAELMFEIRYEGQLVSVTKNKLFDLARKGRISPDALVTIAGTKVFADSIDGIIFGDQPSAPAAPPPPPPRPPSPAPPPATAVPAPPASTYATSSSPFEQTASETLPLAPMPPRKKSVYREIGDTYDMGGSRIDASVNNNFSTSAVQAFGTLLFIACLLGGLWYFLYYEKQPEGIIYIEGTLVLDGNPVQGVSVTLIPRGEGGREALGQTNSYGRFKVTTDDAPPGSGAREGEYDVTFSKVEMAGGKKYVIPQKYNSPTTSGLEPIKIEAGGKKTFPFALESGSAVKPPDAPPQEADATPSQYEEIGGRR